MLERGGYELFQMTEFAITNPKRGRIPLAVSRVRLAVAAISVAIAAMSAVVPAKADDSPPVTGSGLPVPRFVSLKSDRVNLRNGPGTDYPTGWVYRRAGLPVEVIKEFETWREVRDSDGVTGWVLQSLLSGRRTGLVLPWERKSGSSPLVPIMASDSSRSGVVAKVEAGVIADLHSCDGRWCRVTVDQYSGYIEQKKLWGVYEGETFK
ncbi:conserved protein of unknown function; SH3 domain [Hyphomicrobium sp. MC1]|nr:conserved protein of unknown function; SH3 domain [Hyphomicrobium sp. MC1]